jgi:hypothetical protein
MRLDPASVRAVSCAKKGFRMAADFVNRAVAPQNRPGVRLRVEATPVSGDHTMRRISRRRPGHFPVNMIPRQGGMFHASGFWKRLGAIPYGVR